MSKFTIEKLEVTGSTIMGDNATQLNAGESEAASHRTEELTRLALDLARLRAAISTRGIEPDRDEIEALDAAASAAQKGDRPSAIGSLSKVGEWVVDVATKIGVPLAVAALKEALHM